MKALVYKTLIAMSSLDEREDAGSLPPSLLMTCLAIEKGLEQTAKRMACTANQE